MVAHTRRALDLAIQFRKAIALDLVTVSAQDSYDALKLTVQNMKRRLMLAEAAALEISRLDKAIEPLEKTIKQANYVPSRQEIDAAWKVLTMSGLSEPAKETHDKDSARMSLAELEAMIKDLKVIDNASPVADVDTQVIDIFS